MDTICENNDHLLALDNKLTMLIKYLIMLYRGEAIIIGLCVPTGAKDIPADKMNKFLKLETGTEIEFAASMDDLKTNSTTNVFFDTTKGVVYRKFVETRDRTPEDLSDCIGGLKSLDACKLMQVMLAWADNEGLVDLNEGKCDIR